LKRDYGSLTNRPNHEEKAAFLIKFFACVFTLYDRCSQTLSSRVSTEELYVPLCHMVVSKDLKKLS